MVHVDKSSWAFGELAPALRSRPDMDAYASGADTIENFVVSTEAVLTRRPGTRFIAPVPDEGQAPQFVPFRAGKTDQAVLVFTPGRMRVARDNGLLETDLVGLPFGADDLDKIRAAQSVDKLYIAWANGRPKELARQTSTAWTIADYASAKGPLRPQNVDTAWTLTCAAPVGQEFTVVASKALFEAGHVGTVWRIDEPIDASTPQWLALETIAAGDLRRYNGHVYRAENAADSGSNAPTHTEGSVVSGSGKVKWTYLHDGFVYATIKAVTSPTEATVVASGNIPATLAGAATYRWWEAAWSDVRGWPDDVRLLDNQRIMWSRRDEFWISVPGDFYSFHQDETTASSISGRLVPRDGSRTAIEWIVGSSGALVGAANGVWQVRAATVTDPLDQTNIRAIEDGTDGSASLVPAIVDGGVIYIGTSGERLHFCELDRIQEKITISEPSVRASHLFAGSPAVQVVYQRDPHRLLWVRREDGGLLALSWRPEMQVLAWTAHPAFHAADATERLCVIRSSNGRADELWLATRRTINGVTRRYIEKLAPFVKNRKARRRPMPLDAWFVDCGLTYSGAPTKSIAGLDHLEGRTVRVFADGGQRADAVVAGGRITLSRPASFVLVGLPLKGHVVGLPVEVTTSAGSSKPQAKKSTRVTVEYVDAAGGEVAINGAEPSALLTGGGSRAMELRTGRSVVSCDFETDDDRTVTVSLTCDDVFPFTLIGLSADLDITGG